VAASCAERYGVEHVSESWEDLLAWRLDAVMILTWGDHR
jgi:predicted dehydrogenase